MNLYTNTFYDSVKNRLITNREIGNGDNWECIGCRKLAEAMTFVSEKERLLVWKATSGNIIYLNELNSKLRHKLKKLGITTYYKRPSNKPELLEKINKKYNLK